MPETIDPPTTATTATGVESPAQAPPSSGAAPSRFQPANPAFEGVKQRLSERLAKKAVPRGDPPKPSMLVKEPAAATVEDKPTAVAETDTETAAGDAKPAEPAPDTEATATDTDKPAATDAAKPAKKLSPWRMLDDYKKTANELRLKLETAEKALQEARTAKPAELPKEVQDRLSAAEAKVREYEDDIRFSNYQKHPEFVEKYQKPYDAAWARAIGELAEVTVTDPATGTARPAAANDMLALLNLPLGKAREYANQMFGEFSDDAMAHRKELKSLFDTQQAALKEARETGLAREKQAREQAAAQETELKRFIGETWNSANREVVTDPKHGRYFAPVEGDQEGNAALAKGYELVDKAFGEDPREPGITQEERAARVKRHVALRNRAAAFGRMRQWLAQRDAKIEELQKALDEYAESEPGQGGGTTKPQPVQGQPSDPFARLRENLLKRAR